MIAEFVTYVALFILVPVFLFICGYMLTRGMLSGIFDSLKFFSKHGKKEK